MFRLKLSSKIAILFSIVSTTIIFLTGVFYTYYFTKTIERDVQKFLVQKSTEIIQDHLVLTNGQLMFKKGENGETIGSRLRDFDLSGIILDEQGNILESYGIYKNISESEIFNTFLSTSIIESIRTSKKPHYEDITISQNRMYDSYTIPLIRDSTVSGILQLAKEGAFLQMLISTNISLLFFILPLSILLSSMAGYVVTKMALIPLTSLIQAIEQSDASNLNDIQSLPMSSSEEIKKLTVSFQQLAKRIEEAVLKQKTFLTNASHELKTPLTRAVTSIDVVLDTPENIGTETITMLSNIKNELVNLGCVVDELLTLSRVTTHQQKPKKVKPKYVVDQIIQAMKDECESKHITVSNEIDENEEVFIVPEHLHIAFRNILHNAYKYNYEHGTIRIRSEQTLVYRILCNNTGLVIPKDELDQIFDRFKRGRAAGHYATGFGLGMAIVKDIADANRLGVHIESDKVNGTTISISGFEVCKNA